MFFPLSKPNMIVYRKPHLPEKTCAACGRRFAWRKKWERVWDEVRYCSDRCRQLRGRAPQEPSDE